MFINTRNQKKHSIRLFVFAITAGVTMLAGSYQSAFAAWGSQKTFKSPEEAFKAIAEAVKENDTKELLAIFGPSGKGLIFSGDEVADKAGRGNFLMAYEGIALGSLRPILRLRISSLPAIVSNSNGHLSSFPI